MQLVGRFATRADLRTLPVEDIRGLRAGRVAPDAPARALQLAVAARVLGGRHPQTTVQDTTVPGAVGDLPLRVTTPRLLPQDAPLVVHLHGGGWVLGSPEQYDWLCSRIAHGLGAVVASVDYRKAPEHPAPAAAEDALAATVALLGTAADRFGATGPAAVVGDSAGGNLAALVALDRRDAGDDRLAAQWLVYPGVDLTRSFPSHAVHREALFLPRSSMDQFLDLYLAGGVDPADPRVSPWFVADVAGQAPALVQVAELDPLVDEGTAWARRLEEAGVPTRLTTYPDVPHGFQSLPGLTRAANASLSEGLAFLRGTLRPA
jgi:acetyl esterase